MILLRIWKRASQLSNKIPTNINTENPVLYRYMNGIFFYLIADRIRKSLFQILVYQRPFYIVNIYTIGFLGEGKEGKNLGLNQKIQGYRLIILDKNQSFLVVNKQSLKRAVGKAEAVLKA